MENTRTEKIIKSLRSFSKEIFVICPHCSKKAIVITQIEENTIPYQTETKVTFKCDNCFKPLIKNRWYGPIEIFAKTKNCGFCGSEFKFSQKVDKYNTEAIIKCEVCLKEKLYTIDYNHTYANNKQATDPYFGLQLWLQTTIEKNIFWAYNYEHLEYLEKFVSAKLREQEFISKYSLSQRLPNFIKLAKNRDRILKIIERQKNIKFDPKN